MDDFYTLKQYTCNFLNNTLFNIVIYFDAKLKRLLFIYCLH